MKRQRSYYLFLGALPLVMITVAGRAQTGGDTAAAGTTPDPNEPYSAPVQVIEPRAGDKNQFNFSYRMGFNFSAEFSGLGGFGSVASFPPPPSDGSVPRIYDDGYVRPSAFAPPGTTWDYQYQNQSQIQATGEGYNILMHSTAGAANGSLNADNGNTSQGLELIYDRKLGQLGKAAWGLEGGIGFQNLTISQNGVASGSVSGIEDSFTWLGLPGLGPNPAPYTGQPPQPGVTTPYVADTPSSRTPWAAPYSQAIGGNYKLDSSVFTFRVGPYLEFPFNERWSFALSGGFSLIGVNGQFSFNETVMANGVTEAVYSSRATTGSGWLPGGYGGGRFICSLNDGTMFFVGAQWQGGGTYTQQATPMQAPGAAPKEVKVNFGGTVYFMAGMGFSF